jgi:hypothetical protein
LSVRAERILWHQRLGHPSDAYLYNAHRHITGVPAFKHTDPVLDQCPVCLPAKLKKRAAGNDTTRTATVPFQGLSIDFAFTGQKSKDKDRSASFLGLNGESCYIMIADHATGTLYGTTRISKGSPLNWLRAWLHRHSPTVDNKYVVLDQGGELYHNPAIRDLFKKEFLYDVYPTGADASHQNGPVERSHQTVGNALRTMLNGANLDARFWPYAFQSFLRLKNALSKDNKASSYETLHHSKPDFTQLRTFGCRVWVRPPGKRTARLTNHARKGIFLGYLPNTLKNILWFDVDSNRIKIAFHARFDEGMNDLPLEAIPPNVQHLHRMQAGDPIPADTVSATITPFGFHLTPFLSERDVTVKVKCSDPTFGFRILSDSTSNRAYVSEILPRTSSATMCSSPKATSRKYKGSFLTAINDSPVFTAADATRLLVALRATLPAPTRFTVTLAPEPLPSLHDRTLALHEHDLDDLATRTAPDDGLTIGGDELRAIHALRSDHPFSTDEITTDELDLLIHSIQSESVTAAERALGRFTRRRLRNLDNWPFWKVAETKQLDQFHELGMFGSPIIPPKDAIILNPHWQYKVKNSGQRRSRNCCDGSPRASPHLHAIAETYSSCVEQPAQRLFFALALALNFTTFGGDAQDAYAHSPAPTVPTFVRIDDAYSDWYFDTFNIRLNRGLVLPVQRALQGHPESGVCWEKHINAILNDSTLNFKSTTHERNIYQATIKGQRVLLLCQVDDFALACADPAIAVYVYEHIGLKLRLPKEPKPPFEQLGIVDSFNGVDVLQTRKYTKLSCESYIRRLLLSHNWSTPSATDTASPSRPREPLNPSDVHAIYHSTGPAEHTLEHAALSKEMGFNYRTLLGELLYAYISARPDIGYAITTLAKFAKSPGRIHYSRLKGIAKYLRNTLDWGILYWRPTDMPSLPLVPLKFPIPKDDLPTFPLFSDPFLLTGYVDAAHANELVKRRSTTGYGFMLAGGIVAYRSKTQTITATSSTEAEFIAAVSAAKVAKYLRSILSQLGFPQKSATPLYEDNESAIKMINAGKPTERSRHIDIQYFAIQDWRQAGDIILKSIPGIINPADDFTKALGWVLHSRHARRLMGHYGYT